MTNFGYITDHNERGEYAARVVNLDTGEDALAIQNEENGCISLVEDGYMRNIDDMQGLFEYMVMVGLAHAGDDLDLMSR